MRFVSYLVWCASDLANETQVAGEQLDTLFAGKTIEFLKVDVEGYALRSALRNRCTRQTHDRTYYYHA